MTVKKLCSPGEQKEGCLLKGIAYRGLQQGLNVTWTLGKVIFRLTLLVSMLQYIPVLQCIMGLVSPLLWIIVLPGEADVPLVLGNALNLYAGIGAIISFDFTVKDVFIMAIMLSFCHNLL